MKNSRVHTIRENHRWIEVERRGGFDGVFNGYQNVTDMQKWSLKLNQPKPNPSQGDASN